MVTGSEFIKAKVKIEEKLSEVFEGRDVNVITEQYFSVWCSDVDICKKLALKNNCDFVTIKDKGNCSQRMIFKLPKSLRIG